MRCWTSNFKISIGAFGRVWSRYFLQLVLCSLSKERSDRPWCFAQLNVKFRLVFESRPCARVIPSTSTFDTFFDVSSQTASVMAFEMLWDWRKDLSYHHKKFSWGLPRFRPTIDDFVFSQSMKRKMGAALMCLTIFFEKYRSPRRTITGYNCSKYNLTLS